MKKSSRSAYTQIVLALTLLTVLVGSMASVLSYQLFNRFYTDNLSKNAKRVMQYETSIFENNVMGKARSLLTDLSVNAQYGMDLGVFCQSEVPGYNVAVYRVWDALLRIRNLYSPMLASIIVYYPMRDIVISDNLGYKAISDGVNAQISSFIYEIPPLSAQRSQFWAMNQSKLPALTGSHVALGACGGWQTVPNARNAQVIIALNDSYLRDALNRMAGEDASAFLLDEKGNVLASSLHADDNAFAGESTLPRVLAAANCESVSIGANIYTSAALSNLAWRVTLVTHNSAYTLSSRMLARQLLLAVGIALLAGITITLVLSRRLYSPIGRLMTAISDLPARIPDSGRGEYVTLFNAINMLSSRLSDTERVLRDNQPLIRNIMVENMLSGQDVHLEHFAERLRFAGIEMPYSNFCAVKIEVNGHQILRLPTEASQLLFLTLRDALEAHARKPYAYVYCCMDTTSGLRVIVNCAETDDSVIDDLADETRARLNEMGVDWILARGGWKEGREGLSESWAEARQAAGARFYIKEGEHFPKYETASLPPQPAVVQLESEFQAGIADARFADAAACAQKLCQMWDTLPVKARMRSVKKLCDAILNAQLDESRDLSPFLNIEEALWNISGFYPLIKEILLSQPDKADGQTKAEWIVRQTEEYVNAHLADNLSLEAVASAMHFNPKYFSRMFKELSGMQLSDFINDKRLKRASVCLKDPKLSVEEIAALTGYNSAQYFIRKFKASYGMTPREYRMRGQAEEGARAE